MEKEGGSTEDTAVFLSSRHLVTFKGTSLPLKFISFLDKTDYAMISG